MTIAFIKTEVALRFPVSHLQCPLFFLTNRFKSTSQVMLLEEMMGVSFRRIDKGDCALWKVEMPQFISLILLAYFKAAWSNENITFLKPK